MFLANNQDAKDTDMSTCILTANIENIYIRNTCIGNTYAVSIAIRCFDIGSDYIRDICIRKTFVKGVKLRTLAKSGVI